MERTLRQFRIRPVVLQWLMIVLLGLGHSRAQSSPADLLRGVVKDQTGAAVVLAKVVLRSEPNATQATNERGEFAFSPAPRETAQVEVSASGFETRIVEWRPGSDGLEIVLRPAVPGQEITVSANRTSTRLVETPTSVVVLSRDDLRSEEHTSELQSLAYLVCRLLLEKKKKRKEANYH